MCFSSNIEESRFLCLIRSDIDLDEPRPTVGNLLDDVDMSNITVDTSNVSAERSQMSMERPTQRRSVTLSRYASHRHNAANLVRHFFRLARQNCKLFGFALLCMWSVCGKPLIGLMILGH